MYDLEAVHAVHVDVEKNEIEIIFLDSGQRFLAAGCFYYIEIVACHDLAEHCAYGLIVIYYKNKIFCHNKLLFYR